MSGNLYGLLLRNFRKSRNLRLREVAFKAQIALSYLSRIETGERSVPPREIQDALACAIGLTDDEISALTQAIGCKRRDMPNIDPLNGAGMIVLLIDAKYLQNLIPQLLANIGVVNFKQSTKENPM